MLSELLQLTRPLVLFDLETTGKDPATARACSLAMRVHRPNSTEVVSYQTLVNPTISIPKEAVDVHGISDEIIQRGCARCWQFADVHPNGEDCLAWKPVPRFKDLANRLYTGFKDADFGGYNVRYDLRVAQEEFNRCGLPFDYSTSSLIDALRIWQILEPRSLEDAVEHFLGRKMSGAHNAAVDIESTETVLIAQLTRHLKSSILPRNMKELGELIFPRDPTWIDSEGKFRFIGDVPCFNFGKWSGKPMRDHKDYIAWMFGGNFTAEVKKICDEALAGRFPKKAQ